MVDGHIDHTLAILTIVVACEVLFNNGDDNTSTIFMVLS